MSELEEVPARSRAEWRAWLSRHHGRGESVWLVYPKKGTKHFTDLSYDAIVEEALCFGWVDSVPRRRDDGWAMIRVSPRKPRSGWSKKNKERVARLIRENRMTAAGLAKITAAQRDGSWTALDASEALEMPPDLARALARNARAKKNFESFPPGSRKIILQWILGAKRAETRAVRIAETVRLAAEGKRANHYREK